MFIFYTPQRKSLFNNNGPINYEICSSYTQQPKKKLMKEEKKELKNDGVKLV